MNPMQNHYQVDQTDFIEFSMKLKKIFSENTYLAAGNKKKKVKGILRKVPYLYKRHDVRAYQGRIEKVLYRDFKESIITNIEFFSNGKYFSVFEYHLNHSIDRRDLSNMKKLLEDSMTNVIKKVLKESKSNLKFDDSDIYETREVKLPDESDSGLETLRITLFKIT